MCVLRYTFNVV